MGKLILIFLVFLSSKLIAEDREWIFIDSVKVGDSMMKIRGEFIVVDSLDNKYIFEDNTDEINTNIDKPSYIFIFDNNKWDTVSYEKKYNFILTPVTSPLVASDNSIFWTSFIYVNMKIEEYLVKLKDKKLEIFKINNLDSSFNIHPYSGRNSLIDRNSIIHIFNTVDIMSLNTTEKKVIKIDSSFSKLLMDSIPINFANAHSLLFLNSNNSLSILYYYTQYQVDTIKLKLVSMKPTDSSWGIVTEKSFSRYWGPVRFSSFNDQLFVFVFGNLQKERKNLFYHFDKDWKEYDLKDLNPGSQFWFCSDIDNGGNYWLPVNGLDLLKIKDGRFDHIPTILPYGLNNLRVIKFDKQNNLWCLRGPYSQDSSLYVWAKNGNIYSKKDENKEISHLRLSPNPVTEKLTLINIPDNATEFEIYDQFGNRQISGLISGQIDVSLLPAGVYFIKLNNSQRPLKFLKI